MATETHIFDEDGDLILILSNPPEQPDENISYDGERPFAQIEEAADEWVKRRMLVSSKHMMISSPVFRAMLHRKNFKEGRELGSKGKLELPLPDDNVAAMTILLDIIHCRNRRVPRYLDLDQLTQISILVDKYQMAETVEVLSDVWIDSLKRRLPASYDPNPNGLARQVHRWLGISWVFGKGEEFKRMTELIERNCWANLVESIEEGLPIPDIIISSILERRQGALFELYDLIEKTVRVYQQSDTLCPRTDDEGWRLQCDYLLLGSLTKSATILGILPVPPPPYGDISFDAITDRFFNLDIQAICDSIDRPYIDGEYPKPAHGLKEVIQEKIESLEERLSGLDIQDFKKNGQNN